LDEHLSNFEILDISAVTSIGYAAVRTVLKQSGTPIPANDAWIAALALQHGLPVLSRDQHFDAVPEVKRVRW